MNILILNSGSSSIKFQLLQMPEAKVIASGLVERIGLEKGVIHYKTDTDSISLELPVSNHADGLQKISELLMDEDKGVVHQKSDIDAVGHRVVHGGSQFSDTTIINQEVKDKIRSLFQLAPLHNPPNLTGIEVAEEIFPAAHQVAVFDTAFHQSLPEKVYRFAIPNRFADEENIRAYGFHGISHKYVSEQAEDFLKQGAKLITIHLGNGCSMTAIEDGQSVDHSMGFGPNDGLMMGTRSGDIDQAVIFFLQNEFSMSAEEVSNMLSKESGMLGLTGFSDLREIEKRAEEGDKKCQLALVMNAYRIKKYIGSFIAAMNGVDALVFTAGIGENSSKIRSLVCENMNYLGIELDEDKNKVHSKEIRDISTNESKVRILVIPTNEELEIARQSYELLQ